MARRMTLLGLVAVTYFMVSGGPYGLEDLVGSAGYGRSLIILALVPLLWALPTALMVGELAAAIPAEGGFYIWVTRALGEFWGFQEAWLSLAASVFEMAIYPTLFVAYLNNFVPIPGYRGVLVALALIVVCCIWNLRGARAVGGGTFLLGIALLVPFAALIVLSGPHSRAAAAPAPLHGALLSGILVAMWNFMGWDNASTVAEEVERPQVTYPLALWLTLAAIVITYALPIVAAWRFGIPLSSWTTGSWAAVGGMMGGRWLEVGIIAGGMISSAGMLNSLMLSYTRLPAALAEAGYLPRFVARTNSRGVPWVALISCSVAWAACLGLKFQRLVLLDILLYGGSLVLEFVALAVLRWREPRLVRPFTVPGGKLGVLLIGIPPTVLLLIALVVADHSGLTLGLSLILIGIVLWALLRRFHTAQRSVDA